MPVAATSGAAVLAMAWRKCKERPLLAASVKGRGVMLLDESGDLFEETVIRATQGDADAVVLDWSPMTTAKGNLLAIGCARSNDVDCVQACEGVCNAPLA
eukprot:2260695-Pleurochrysis_carterae.AAC.1